VELARILEIELPSVSKAPARRYTLRDFLEFRKLPGAVPFLQTQRALLTTLSSRAHPLFQPLVNEYATLIGIIAAGKGNRKTVADLEKLELARIDVLQRFQRITDYLNWYEATKVPVGTAPFASFLRLARQTEPEETPVPPPSILISEYLNAMEREFEPPTQ
jgi:hypothetical protein